MALIELKNVYYKYPGMSKWILKGINLKISHGKILIAGSTGSGKTTLLRVITGLIPEIYGGELSGSVNRNCTIGFVPQNFDAFILMPRVRDEIVFVLENKRLSKREIECKVKYIAEMLDISHLLDRDVSTLSMGERQRVAIASVLALEPEVLVFDEPLAYLDPRSSRRFIELLEDLNLKSIVIAEHRLDQVVEFMDRVIVIKNGEIIADGEPFEALSKAPPDVPKPTYVKFGFRSLEEMVNYAISGKRLV